MLLIPGIIGSAAPQIGDFESIETHVVGSGGASSITFSSIPSTFQHLQIRAIARSNRGDAADFFRIRFNGDTGANYKSHELYGDGSSAFSRVFGESNEIVATYSTATTATANCFGVFIMDILDYGNTSKNKTLRNLGGWDANGSGAASFSSGFRNNTAAITSVSIAPLLGSNFVQYSHFALYGIRG